MFTDRKFPTEFLLKLEALEAAYLSEADPIRQSGFGGGPARWRAEREPILRAVERNGDFLDIGCANGYLLECLIRWGGETGMALTPHGLDFGPGLINLARQRFPRYKANFGIGNAWDWHPPQKYTYVYTLYDCVPLHFLEEYVRRLLARMVRPGGRLIVGAYGSRSQNLPPFDISSFLAACGHDVAGTSHGGDPPVARFAWVDKI